MAEAQGNHDSLVTPVLCWQMIAIKATSLEARNTWHQDMMCMKHLARARGLLARVCCSTLSRFFLHCADPVSTVLV